MVASKTCRPFQVILFMGSLLLLSQITTAAKLADKKTLLLDGISRNAKKMGLSENVVKCLARDLDRFEAEWTPGSPTDTLNEQDYHDVAEKNLPKCLIISERAVNKSKMSASKATVVHQKKTGYSSASLPTWSIHNSCTACDGGCHFCCIFGGGQSGPCWSLYCGAIGTCN